MLHTRRGAHARDRDLRAHDRACAPDVRDGGGRRRPDQVLAWNLNAYNELIVTAGQATSRRSMHLAMVHGAVYDAVNAIDGGYEPYLGSPSATGTESKDAAAAAPHTRCSSPCFPAIGTTSSSATTPFRSV